MRAAPDLPDCSAVSEPESLGPSCAHRSPRDRANLQLLLRQPGAPGGSLWTTRLSTLRSWLLIVVPGEVEIVPRTASLPASLVSVALVWRAAWVSGWR